MKYYVIANNYSSSEVKQFKDKNEAFRYMEKCYTRGVHAILTKEVAVEINQTVEIREVL